jgi:hypothetical protein
MHDMNTHTFTFTDDELDCLVDAMWRHNLEAVHAESSGRSSGRAMTGVIRQWLTVSDRLRVRFAEAQRAGMERAWADPAT